MAIKLGCDGKVKYGSYTEATKKVKAMKRNPHISKGDQTLGVYRCKDCTYWHIGNNGRLDRNKRKDYKRG